MGGTYFAGAPAAAWGAGVAGLACPASALVVNRTTAATASSEMLFNLMM
jgi:hypothetical protein